DDLVPAGGDSGDAGLVSHRLPYRPVHVGPDAPPAPVAGGAHTPPLPLTRLEGIDVDVVDLPVGADRRERQLDRRRAEVLVTERKLDDLRRPPDRARLRVDLARPGADVAAGGHVRVDLELTRRALA